MNNKNELPESRRDFLKNASLATVMAMLGGVELRAEDAPKAAADGDSELTKAPPPPPINVGVIGLGEWGREILKQLALLPSAPIVALCDIYPKALRKGAAECPKAQPYDDYAKLLADPNVQAVIIATPTGTHKEIAVAAIAAGKHVYCEAPLANTIEDAKAIAAAARDLVKLVFQPGLQQRSHPQLAFLVPFIRSGALGTNVMVRGQWHANTSWYRPAPSQEREDALNWRLHRATSTGLLGEEGIHQIDTVSNFLKGRPKAVTGFSSTIRTYDDRREEPDTVQAIFEFPHGVNFFHDLTICDSYEKAYEVYLGADSAMMMRDFKAWLFKEVSAAQLGWEVYARHDTFYKETGIALVANASKQTTLAGSAASFNPYDHEPLYYALEAFTDKAGRLSKEVRERAEIYPDEDIKAVAEYLKTVPALNSKPAATWEDGLSATVMAIIANQAALKKQKITFEKEWFENMRMLSRSAVALAICLASALHAVGQTRYNTQSVGNSVRIDGTSTAHDWEMEGSVIGGYVELGAGVTLDKSQAAPAGLAGDKLPMKAHVIIPVSTVHSKADHLPEVMDGLMQKNMKAADFPRIEYTLAEMTFKGPHAAGKPFDLDTKGDLVIAGKTNKVSFPVTIEPLEDGKIRVIGAAAVKMTDYGVDPPAPNFGLGMMRCGDDVKIQFDWTLKEKK